MKHLLENDYIGYIGKRTGIATIGEASYSNDFALVDKASCDGCFNFFRTNCNFETMLVSTNGKKVLVMEHERFMNDLGTNKGGNCDYILYDEDKIVFADLYCGFEQFLYDHTIDGVLAKGKRKKVREQTEVSIARLCNVPSLATYIESKAQKLAVIGYRVKDDEIYPVINPTISKSEQMMMQMARELETRNLSAPMAHGFRYKPIKYPQPLVW